MKNNIATWYTKGIQRKRRCCIGKAECDSIVLEGDTGYNRLKAAIRRIGSEDNIAGFQIGNVPVYVYHTPEEVTVIAFYDKKDCAVEMYSREPWRITTLAERISLPKDELELMMLHPDRFDKKIAL